MAAAMADQVGLALTNFHYRSHLREDLLNTINTLILAIEEKVPLIRGRSSAVAECAQKIALNLNIDEDTQQTVVLAGMLHNIGILNPENTELFCTDTAAKSSEERLEIERARIKASLNVIAGMKCYDSIQNTIRYMYERGDMSGPFQLERYEIPESAKIVGISIEFEEQLRIRGESNRELILKEMESKADFRYDKRIVRALIAQ